MSLDVYLDAMRNTTIYENNITHNLGAMAKAAGIYEALWRPEETGITTAAQLIEPLRNGLELLLSNRERFEKLNPENGWGDYEGLVKFVKEYLSVCINNPDATITATP